MAMPITLELPHNISEEEKSAVVICLKKSVNNRFKIVSKFHQIVPNSVVDLISIVDGTSLATDCQKQIAKRFRIDDIDCKKIIKSQNIDLTVIDNEYLSKGICCFVQTNDLQTFANRSVELTEYGKTLKSVNAYEPDRLEMCLVLYPDNDGTHVWYRAQFQQRLANGQARVGLIDYGVSAVIYMANVRMFDQRFAYERISFSATIKSIDGISIELLNTGLLDNFSRIQAEWLKILNSNCFEIGLSELYFFMENDMIEVWK